ncbi:pepsin/retropepsin-like aspartic protease family protein [Flavilitoribacter nigricans]|uniref:Peptidase A2 domain-containing protein n=1 Tax=Flavilitoribacter nigricans (strain ATCC 23147 / DSM 23189 / NBRC 102662 / NCIMB 1420 / SS-2) TaxID=1122177 RepID=A0A2D0N1B0_FLAN2|nr:pepsin/retropepsin-like aspartic protease family protein [Flavilitoribacter nigricans]PHN02285.1 hypothetical protein CRP01_32825 [Flavilitoribacter nigricans DSM 23189 = NBRC 102662]
MIRYFFTLLIICQLFPFAGRAQADIITIPFRIIGNLIVIQGRIDGQLGNLILDTGVSKTLLNQRFFLDQVTFSTNASAGFRSWKGNVQDAPTTLINLELPGFSRKDDAQLVDLRPLEQHRRLNVLAVIGAENFRNFELELDFLSRLIRLHPLDKQGNRPGIDPAPLEILPLSYRGHLYCVDLSIGEQHLTFGLDTGAEFNVISENFYQLHPEHFYAMGRQMILGLSGGKAEHELAELKQLRTATLILADLRTIIMPENRSYGQLDRRRVDGLLGYEFFHQLRVSFNFKKREFYIWDGPRPALAGGDIERSKYLGGNK